MAYQRFAKFFLVRRQRDEGDWLSLQDWREVLEWVTGWAREVALISSPDMWEQSALRRQLVSAEASADENTPFSQTELAEIAAQLKAMREELREQGKLSAAMDADLDEAEKASRRLGRKDWYSCSSGQ